MTWPLVLADLVATLGQIAIEYVPPTGTPVDIAIVHVYDVPPATIDTFPVFVIVPPDAIEVERGQGVRAETETVRCRFLFQENGDTETAVRVAEAFRRAVIVAFDTKVNGHGGVTLGGTAVLESQSVDQIALGKHAGHDVTVFEFTLTLKHYTPVSIS